MLHWLGTAFDPLLAGYFGSTDWAAASDVLLEIIGEHSDKIAGVKMSLLDAAAEVSVRERLPEGVRMFTGDDFNYVGLIGGGLDARAGASGHSDALLGAFAAITPVASAAIQALDAGDPDRYLALLGPTEELSRQVFAAPTFYYKTGVAFLAWLNGHQTAFQMVGGLHSARSLPHLSRIVELANASNALEQPELAARAVARDAAPEWSRRMTLRQAPLRQAQGPGDDPRLSINQATIKYADLATALRVTADAGVQAIGLWREPVQEVGLATAAKLLTDSGLRFTTHCRGGFFTPAGRVAAACRDRRQPRGDRRGRDPRRRRRPGSTAILVLVAGGLPEGSRDLIGARERVRDAIGELAPDAAAAGVTLAIEPLHPMYASDRAVVSTLGQALDIAADFDPAVVGATVDTFHIWWDPDVLNQIARAGREGRIATYQVCDWKTPLPADVLLGRHYPGDGVIDFASLTGAVLDAGYRGDIEVEIFNEQIWADTPENVVRRTAETFGTAISPLLGAPVDSRS